MSESGGKDAGSDVPRRRRMLRVGVQVVGFLAGLASLAWCVSLALRPENKEQFEKLTSAPPQLILGMLALSLATVVLQGVAFWIVIRPVRPLSVADLSAVNAVAMFLGYLPMKAGALFRVVVHNRRDRVPVLLIGAWFAAVGGLTVAAMAPLAAATIVRSDVDGWWAAMVAGMELGIGIAIVLAARLFMGARGRDRLVAFATRFRLAPVRRLLTTRAWANVHFGFDMLAAPGATFGSIGVRLLDAAVQTSRLLVAARVLGVSLPLSDAIPVGVTFFLVGALSPAGAAGLREGAATGLAGLLVAKTGAGGDAFAAFAPVALLVTATEALVLVFGAAVGVAWLRPDRLLKLRRS